MQASNANTNHALEAFQRATESDSTSNYSTILREFAARGIPPHDILPRVNVFTFDAWRAVGRCVRKGEKGVRLSTFVPSTRDERDPSTGETKRVPCKRARTVYVFHISQTIPLDAPKNAQ